MLLVGLGHVSGEIGPCLLHCRSCSPFLEGVREDATVFEVGGEGADGLEITDGVIGSGKVLGFAYLVE